MTISPDKPSPIVARYAPRASGGKALDIGFGNGRDSLYLARLGFSVTALDVKKESVENLTKKAREVDLPVHVHHCDVRNFPLPPNYFAFIVAQNSLFFLSETEFRKTIDRIRNSLTLGGLVIITSFTTADPMFKKMRLERKKIGPREFSNESGEYWYFLAPGELKQYFKDFKIIFSGEQIVEDKGHPGIPEPHKHGIAQIVVQKTARVS